MKTGYPWLAILAASLGIGALGLSAAPDGAKSWIHVTAQSADTGQTVTPGDLPRAFRGFRLDLPRVERSLAGGTAEITLPLPDGRLQRFAARPGSAMAPELAARFPRIRSYAVTSVEGPPTTGFISVTPAGVHASLFNDQGTIRIRRFAVHGELLHLSYLDRDDPTALGNCGTLDLATPTGASTTPPPGPSSAPPRTQADSGLLPGRPGAPAPSPATGGAVTLKTYDLAITTTGEFFRGIVPDPDNDPEALDKVMAVVHDLVYMDLNPIYERDLAIRFELVSGTEALFFDDPAGDPFDNDKCVCDNEGPNGQGLQFDADAVLDAAVPGTIAGYDVGHLLARAFIPGDDCFGIGCGAIAGVCNADKGKGATKHGDPDHPAVLIQAHELGHQIGGHHTWSGFCIPSGAIPATSAYEPGGGSTVMGYPNCGDDGISGGDFKYFHNYSVSEIQGSLASKSCQSSTLSQNRKPTVDTLPNCHCCTAQLIPCVRVPADTGFKLSGGSASDDGYGDHDFLSYTWEQMDLADEATSAVVDDGPGDPLFRSLFPEAPQGTLVREFEDKGIPGEILPTSPRYVPLRLVVRDNYRPAGGFNSNRMQLEVIGDPLELTYPNGGEAIDHYDITVTWDPGASTTGVLGFTTTEVEILFSADGGENWQPLTEDPTPNDGSEAVLLPALCPTTFEGLIKVQGVGNLELSDRSDAVFRVYCPCPVYGSCSNDVCGCHDIDTGYENCWTGTELEWCYPGTTLEMTSCKCKFTTGGGSGFGNLQQCTGQPFTVSWGCPGGGVLDCPTLTETCDPCPPDLGSCIDDDLEFSVCRRPDFTLMECAPGKTIHLLSRCDCTGLCTGEGQVLRCL